MLTYCDSTAGCIHGAGNFRRRARRRKVRRVFLRNYYVGVSNGEKTLAGRLTHAGKRKILF